MPEAESSPEERFWRFSLAFYALPEVSRALIALQDRDVLDVNIMLFSLWLGISGRGRLSADSLAVAERASNPLRHEIVGPLRTLRRRLKHYPDNDIQRLREGVKALELAGEKLVQTRLARFVGPPREDISREDRLAVAGANFALYLGPERARSAEAMAVRDALGWFMANEAGCL
jgi:uncharacterized protein (TIGR02444 family)